MHLDQEMASRERFCLAHPPWLLNALARSKSPRNVFGGGHMRRSRSAIDQSQSKENVKIEEISNGGPFCIPGSKP